MKLISIGLEIPPIKGLRSHLSMAGSAGNSTQRWWFTPLYDNFVKSDDGLAFQFAGPRAQLMSQEEFVNQAGQRWAAPVTRITTQRFSKQFTEKFPQLADASPVFAELQSLIDLAVMAALLKKERLPEKVDWKMSLFLDEQAATIEKHNVPRQVPTAVNYKMTGTKMIVGEVGGGVTIDAAQTVKALEFVGDDDSKLKSARERAATEKPSEKHPWWWD
jgi:hypothetical protein